MNEAEQANSVERTPKTVLRAMLQAYVDATIYIERLCYRHQKEMRDSASWDAQRDRLWRAVGSIRHELAWLEEYGSLSDFLEWPKWVDDDYQARLRGDRPLDAVP